MPKLARLDDKAFARAVAAYRAGSFAVAKSLLERIAAEQPQHAGARFVLGLLEWSEGNDASAELRFGEARELEPTNAGFCSNWAEAARRRGKLDAAIDRFEQALALNEGSLESHYNLGLALAEAGRLREARDSFRLAAELSPDDGQVARRLAQAHHELGELDEAAELLEGRGPEDARALVALGAVLFHRGEHDAAEAALRRSLARSPSAATHGALLFQSMFNPSRDAASIALEARELGARYFGEPERLPDAARKRDLDPERRLRVGYVSTDFREHVTGNVVLPLLRHHSRERVEVYLYASQARSDAVTDEFRSQCAVWRDIRDLSDERAAALVAADDIDVLVDLGMHLSGSRLGIFARKPAPLQVSWFAYPGTTGLPSIDYRVSDPFLDPPGREHEYTEETLRLPDCFWCWEPLLGALPCGPLPLLDKGYLTFGCLNNFCKLTDETLVAWSGVLGAVPTSRLLLQAPAGRAQRRVRERLTELGVAPERVSFAPYRPRRAYFELYREIDVCLDTLPYNGHTTSLDALWMGVPVLTLVGERCVGRAGLCQARALDLPELVATSASELTRLARELTSDTQRLAELRRTLRARLETSPLMDGPRFAKNFEVLYRNIWRRWCDRARRQSVHDVTASGGALSQARGPGDPGPLPS